MTRLDRRRIAALETWHARQDCADAGTHTLPDGWAWPDPQDLTDVREETEVTAWGSGPVRRLTGLPDDATQVPCGHCGDTILAVDPAERERLAEAERVERERAEERRRAAAQLRATCTHDTILDVTAHRDLPHRRGLCAHCTQSFTQAPGEDWQPEPEETP